MIGRGSYAKVKVAERVKDRAIVAVKIIKRQKTANEFMIRFLPRELSIILTIQHPNIIQVLEVIQAKEVVCLVTEFAERGDLLCYVKSKGYVDESESVRIFQQVCTAVLYLHDRSICHRDLKCENIMLRADWSVALTDFGFSKVVDPNNIMSDTHCGSTAYASPELLRDKAYNPFLSDVWSLGSILFILVTGRMPFHRSNSKKTTHRQLSGTVTYPSRKPGVSVMCKDLVRHTLEPNADRRYTVKQILNHLWMQRLVPSEQRDVDNENQGLVGNCVVSNNGASSCEDEAGGVGCGSNRKAGSLSLDPTKSVTVDSGKIVENKIRKHDWLDGISEKLIGKKVRDDNTGDKDDDDDNGNEVGARRQSNDVSDLGAENSYNDEKDGSINDDNNHTFTSQNQEDNLHAGKRMKRDERKTNDNKFTLQHFEKDHLEKDSESGDDNNMVCEKNAASVSHDNEDEKHNDTSEDYVSCTDKVSSSVASSTSGSLSIASSQVGREKIQPVVHYKNGAGVANILITKTPVDSQEGCSTQTYPISPRSSQTGNTCMGNRLVLTNHLTSALRHYQMQQQSQKQPHQQQQQHKQQRQQHQQQPDEQHQQHHHHYHQQQQQQCTPSRNAGLLAKLKKNIISLVTGSTASGQPRHKPNDNTCTPLANKENLTKAAMNLKPFDLSNDGNVVDIDTFKSKLENILRPSGQSSLPLRPLPQDQRRQLGSGQHSKQIISPQTYKKEESKPSVYGSNSVLRHQSDALRPSENNLLVGKEKDDGSNAQSVRQDNGHKDIDDVGGENDGGHERVYVQQEGLVAQRRRVFESIDAHTNTQ